MADTSKGWIVLFRSIQDHWLWHDKPFSKGQAWIDLLLDVNHETHRLYFGGSLITIKRGQTLTSKLKLAERWGWNRKTVIGFLNVLKADNQLDIKSDNKCTLITITNYNKFQTRVKPKTDNKADNKTDSNGTATGQQRDTNKECKECKELKEDTKDTGKPPLKVIRPFAPPTPSEVAEYAKGIGLAVDAQYFCDYYAARGWRYKGGVQMKDWKAAVRTWKKQGGTHGNERTGFSRGDNTAGAVDSSKYDKAGIPD